MWMSSPVGSSHAGRAPTCTPTGSSRLALLIVSRSSGATTSARAVSECGAMKEATKPRTPQARIGPPLGRLQRGAPRAGALGAEGGRPAPLGAPREGPVEVPAEPVRVERGEEADLAEVDREHRDA